MRAVLNLSPAEADSFAAGLVKFTHNMRETGLFTDDALAALIDRYPRQYYMLNTMSQQGTKKRWLDGDLNDMPGQDVLEAVKAGRLWLCLRRFDIVAPEYHQLCERAFSEVHDKSSGLKTFKRESSLLISSPGARVFYHMDIPFVALWHIRGRKRIWLYDARNKQQLPDTSREGVFLRETQEEIDYREEWDETARAITLAPGDAVTWPLNEPHRVDNLEGLNVSITSEYYTTYAMRNFGVHFANGLLRRKFGLAPRSTRTEGFGAWAKCAFALAAKKSGWAKSVERPMICKFKLNGNSGNPIDLLAPEQYRPIIQD